VADVIVRRNKGEQQERASIGIEPLRMMRDLFRWDPFQELGRAWSSELMPTGFNPDVEVKETPKAFLFKADLPGVQEADIEVTVTGNRLTLQGKREEEREEQSDTYYACERSYGSFTRSFTLPDGVDAEAVQAELKAGVLTVTVPKRPEVQAKRIALKGAEKGTEKQVKA